MEKIYYIDIPQLPSQGGDWVNVTYRNSREEAEQFITQTWGIVSQFDNFITEGEL